LASIKICKVFDINIYFLADFFNARMPVLCVNKLK